MMEKLKELSLVYKAILVILALIMAAIVWAIFSVPELPTQEEANQMAKRAKIMVYENNTMKEEQNGKVIWEVTAKRTELNAETNKARCEGIVGRFYMDDGIVVDGNAKAGGFDGKTKNVFLEGDAVIVTSDGRKLAADKITWVAKEQKAVAEGHVHLTRK